MSLGYEDCKVFVSTVDSQSSAENGIVVQVVGELSNKGGAWRKFAQTFFLAEQPNGYFVLNDIFRYMKEESDEEEFAAGEDGVATLAAETTAPSAPADVLAALDQPIGHSHHDFELAPTHGAPGDAAGVTVVPPMEQQADGEARATLAGLVNGDAAQEHVVELHDEINEEQPEQHGHAVAHPPHVEEQTLEQEPLQGDLAEAQPEPAIATAETMEETPTAATDATADLSEPQVAAPAPHQATPAPQPVEQPSSAPVPAKPAAPKSWASLAAAGSNKWQQNAVVSNSKAVSTSTPQSKVNSGASTPATQAPMSIGASTPAAPASEKGSNDGFITAGPRERRNNHQHSNEQGEGPSDRSRTRTPHFNNNVETGYSVVVSGVPHTVSHASLRNRLSDEFAKVDEKGRKDWAKLSYLDIDRTKETAYVDFEAEWGMNRAVKAGQCSVEGTMLTITAGRGGRRAVQQGGGRGGGRGGLQQQRTPGGPGRGGSNAHRGGGAARAPSGRGQ